MMKTAKKAITTETTINRDVSDFFNTDYKEWAKSVVEERALPSVIDGFKPTARKVVHAAITGSLKDGKLYKLLALSGDAMKLSLYAHGDASLNGVIVGLCKEFNDNLNPLESDSQVGTLRDPDSAGSPRYLYVQHSKFVPLIYKEDYNLLDFVFEEGQYVEPKYYLPIIPVVLCKNNLGVAVGYAMHNIAYSPVDVANACIEFLKTNNISKTTVRPYIRGIDNSTAWSQNSDGEWVCSGKATFNQSKDKMSVTGLPYDTTYDAFEKMLVKFTEAEYIKSWTNLSQGGTIDYEVQFNKGQLKKLLKNADGENKLMQKFKLVKTVPDDLLWMLDENKKLIYFNNINEIISYFCAFRLGVYKERKKRTVKQLEERYKSNSDLCNFINYIIKGKLKIKNRPQSDIKADMLSLKLPYKLISTPMSKLTLEEVKSLEEENSKIKEELDYIKGASERDMYLKDLVSLKKELVKHFKTA